MQNTPETEDMSTHHTENPPTTTETPSYHDLHITTAHLPRTSIFDLPYGYEVTCTRVGGWRLWHDGDLIAGEYDSGLILDVAGAVIVNSLNPAEVTP